jgi:polar amino acid transport system substrate-binding protein
MIKFSLLTAAALVSFLADPAAARTLAAVRASGTLGLCAHPNSLPFASKKEEPPGFQIELGRVIAKELGVTLAPEWVVSPIQVFRTSCDILLDSIVNAEADADQGIKVSKPYYSGGVGLALPADSPIGGMSALNGSTKVAVIASSVAAMKLNQRGVTISVFAFEDDMLDALAAHEVDAAAVTGLSVGYYNKRHPEHAIKFVPPDDGDPELLWNVSVGMRRPDATLREAIDAAIEHLTEDGTIAAIYAKYGITLLPPK